MAIILNIETATPVCSVALADDGKVIAIRESVKKNIHASVITLFIKELFDEAAIRPGQLDAVSVSKGPGSYTGLRIGVSTAKGLCYSLDKPLISVSTLLSMANGALGHYEHEADGKPVLFCPMIDARRMEVYTALYDMDLNVVESVSAKVIDEGAYSDYCEDNRIIFFGNGAKKCREVLGNCTDLVFLDGFEVSSLHMAEISELLFTKKRFEDLAYFEPYYLKDFIAGKPKVKGLK